MSEHISKKDREYVMSRADHCCEYCRMPLRFSLFSFHVDHIISLKHGGKTIVSNLALACGICNVNKGTDIGTFLENESDIVRFFHPRKDVWNEHFEIMEGVIYGKTPIGKSTVKIFLFNEVERIIERKLLIEGGFLKP